MKKIHLTELYKSCQLVMLFAQGHHWCGRKQQNQEKRQATTYTSQILHKETWIIKLVCATGFQYYCQS